MFLFGGLERSDRTRRIPLSHGDVLVWGGEDRLRFHGVLPVKPGTHPRMGERAFVLLPLAELAPGLAQTCGTAAQRALASGQRIERLAEATEWLGTNS